MATEWWYELDAENRVVDVGTGWDEFAMANDSPGATREHVVGLLVTDFVDDPRTRSLLETVFNRVRETDEVVELPFRCDAPTVRRFMSWTGEPTEGGGLIVRTRLLGEGLRAGLPIPGSAGRREDTTIRMCSWCNRIEAEGRWLEAETAAQRLGLFMARRVPEVTHGMCPACYGAVTGDIELADGQG